MKILMVGGLAHGQYYEHTEAGAAPFDVVVKRSFSRSRQPKWTFDLGLMLEPKDERHEYQRVRVVPEGSTEVFYAFIWNQIAASDRSEAIQDAMKVSK